MDVLSSFPARDTRDMRHLLFTLPLPFSLSAANHKRFWPLIDNVYLITKTRDIPDRQPTTWQAAKIWMKRHVIAYLSVENRRLLKWHVL